MKCGAQEYLTVPAEDYLALVQKSMAGYELVPDEPVPVNPRLSPFQCNIRPYFDVDIVYPAKEHEKANVMSADNAKLCVCDYLVYALQKIFTDMGAVVLDASGETVNKDGEQCRKISFHFLLKNYSTTKSIMRVMVKFLNAHMMPSWEEYLNYCSKQGDEVEDVLPFDSSLIKFDPAVYNSGQMKFRALGTSKDGQNRPLTVFCGVKFRHQYYLCCVNLLENHTRGIEYSMAQDFGSRRFQWLENLSDECAGKLWEEILVKR
jgi:hypothetical protein